jgi:hypothetical protein
MAIAVRAIHPILQDGGRLDASVAVRLIRIVGMVDGRDVSSCQKFVSLRGGDPGDIDSSLGSAVSIPHGRITATESQQTLMRAFLSNRAIMQDNDLVGMKNCGQTMSV